jgi:hypothetical protein
MAVHGPGLLPGDLSPDQSRGHPLLFHFLFAVWIQCFGSSDFAVHTCALLLSVSFLIALYQCCRGLFGARAAALILVLAATQVIYFVQSTFVLPEIMVAEFAFLSLYWYARDRLALASIALCILFFVKESGVVFGGVLAIDAVVRLFNRKEPLAKRLRRLFATLLPVLLIAAFFQLQKATYGWYLLPLHTSLIHTDWTTFYAMLREGVYWLFCGDIGNVLLPLFALVLSVVASAVKRDVRYLFLCPPAIIVFILTNKYIIDNTGDVIWVVLFAVCFAMPAFFIIKLSAGLGTSARRFLVLLTISFVAYLTFLAFSQPSYRYLLADIMLYLVVYGISFDLFSRALGDTGYGVAITGILLIGAIGFYSDNGNSDGDMECFHEMDIRRNIIAFLQREHANDKEIVTACYWSIGHYCDTLEGYVTREGAFRRVKHEIINEHTDYAVFDNFCGDFGNDGISKNTDFRQIYRVAIHNSWGEVYKRIKYRPLPDTTSH